MFGLSVSQIRRFTIPVLCCVMLVLVVVSSELSRSQITENQKELDRTALVELLPPGSYDNDPLRDTVLLDSDEDTKDWVGIELLGLRRNRLAYIAKSDDDVTAVVVPATAEDGFNGYVDLLVAINMYGRLQAVRVIKESSSRDSFGVLEIIQSSWIKLFSGNTFRDIKRLSWQKISSDQEYDLFVGASVTPKSVSAKIYDTLIFFQPNRIAFIEAIQ
ncbi:MAG: hypothetical protein AB8B95_07655 [Pseudohongiellaceae bacterium]